MKTLSTKEIITIRDWYNYSTHLLQLHNIKSEQTDSLLLLELVTGFERKQLLVHFDNVLKESQKKLLNHYLNIRLTNYPMAYIIKKVNFYGYDFIVNQNVLIPRPETEILVQKSLLLINFWLTIQKLTLSYIVVPKFIKTNFQLKGVDLGCGSGNIGISITKQIPNIRVDLVDNSSKSLKICRLNVVKNNCKNKVINKDFNELDFNDYRFIVANLPYLPLKFPINAEAKFEPSSALYAGKDGLDDYIKLFNLLKKHNRKVLLIIIEKFNIFDQELITLAKNAGYKVIFNEKFTLGLSTIYSYSSI